MKRTVADIIGTPFLQFHKLAHHINDVDPVGDLLYGVRGDQALNIKYEVISTKVKEWLYKRLPVTSYRLLVTGNR